MTLNRRRSCRRRTAGGRSSVSELEWQVILSDEVMSLSARLTTHFGVSIKHIHKVFLRRAKVCSNV